MNSWEHSWYCNYYDQLFPYDADLTFYLRALDRARMQVLELGAGSGRVAIPIGQAGHSVTGVDSSAQMLERGRAADHDDLVKWVNADVFDYLGGAPEQSTDCIILALNTINEFEPSGRATLFPLLRKCLRPDGVLLLQTFLPNERYFASLNPAAAGGAKWEHHGTRVLSQDVRVDTSLAVTYDRARQALQASFAFVEFDSESGLVRATRRTTTNTFPIYPGELVSCLKLSGFRQVQLYGGFANEELTQHSTDIVVDARLEI